MNNRTKRFIKDKVLGLLVLLAIVGAFFVVMGVLGLLKNSSCDRLDAERVSHVKPGHDTPGPGNTHIKGFGTDRSEYTAYYEAVSRMAQAGC